MSKIIGIVGASGSGKSTIANKLESKLINAGFTVSQFSQDAFYKPVGNQYTNYDEPEALDLNDLTSKLIDLKSGNSVCIPTYDFVTHRRQEQTITVETTDYIIVEGLFLLSQETLRSVFDTTVYLDVVQNDCFNRRLIRDQTERKRTPEDIERQYFDQVLPGFINHILPYIDTSTLKLESQTTEVMTNKLFNYLMCQ